MFELSVAFKYLLPRWRQLSVSIISIISVLVIALVVWLIVVFFSVTYGLEKGWVQKLISLTAPIRISPTNAYYESYYFQIDAVSEGANYTKKTIGEKLAATKSDLYDQETDSEIPSFIPKPDRDAAGEVKDLVKLAFQALDDIAGVRAKEYETAAGNLQIDLKLRKTPQNKQQISQYTYLASYDPGNPSLSKTLLALGESNGKYIDPSLPLPEMLPSDAVYGEAILVPKSYRDAGALVGDTGNLLYHTATASRVQEQTVPVYIAGFYDPGIFPLGNKIVLVNPHLASMIRAAYPTEESALSNGINVRFDHLGDASLIKEKIQKAFKEAGIDSYWKVETYREFEFTKDFLQQLKSEKNIFTLLSMVIILVACSNIVSMLIILVNDKKMEIGILRSMGASSQSIAAIFGLCGVVMGIAGSVLGILLALATLKNLHVIIAFISRVQGFDAFNPAIFGESLPNEVSFEALAFVLTATAIISLIAGVVPAVKASVLRPSAILRSE